MPLLADGDRVIVWERVMRGDDCPGGLTKTQLRSAVNAVDQWLEDNAASYNAALPLAARNALTARQKQALLVAVMRRRAEV